MTVSELRIASLNVRALG
jgi:exonuclease III